MKRLLCAAPLSTLALAQSPVPAAPATQVQPQGTRIAVIVVDGGGLDAATLATLRSLAITELRKRNALVLEDPRLEGLHPLGTETRTLLAELGGRTLALRVAGRLGAKVPLNLEELDGEGRVLGSASLTAGAVEECDVVVPRLVSALLDRKSVADTAHIDTVVTAEARPFPSSAARVAGTRAASPSATCRKPSILASASRACGPPTRTPRSAR